MGGTRGGGTPGGDPDACFERPLQIAEQLHVSDQNKHLYTRMVTFNKEMHAYRGISPDHHVAVGRAYPHVNAHAVRVPCTCCRTYAGMYVHVRTHAGMDGCMDVCMYVRMCEL